VAQAGPERLPSNRVAPICGFADSIRAASASGYPASAYPASIYPASIYPASIRVRLPSRLPSGSNPP